MHIEADMARAMQVILIIYVNKWLNCKWNLERVKQASQSGFNNGLWFRGIIVGIKAYI